MSVWDCTAGLVQKYLGVLLVGSYDFNFLGFYMHYNKEAKVQLLGGVQKSAKCCLLLWHIWLCKHVFGIVQNDGTLNVSGFLIGSYDARWANRTLSLFVRPVDYKLVSCCCQLRSLQIVEEGKLEHHSPHVLQGKVLGDPSANHEFSMFQLHGIRYTAWASREIRSVQRYLCPKP